MYPTWKSRRDGVPVRISDVAFVNIGPGTRRGGLDKEGVEAVGGVVIARYGSNPLEVINNIKDKIKEMAPGLPQKTLPDGTVSKRDNRHARNIFIPRNTDLYHRYHRAGPQPPGIRRDSQHAPYRRDGGRRRRVCRKHHPVYGDAGKQRHPQRESDGKPYL